MATTIINPVPNNNTSDNNIGFLLGGFFLVLLAILFFVYALPYVRSLSGNAGIQINVPKNINVQVQQSK